MATLGSYYIDAPTFELATAVFTDAALSTCAPDGFYSNGIIVRQQVSCSLLPAVACPSCLQPCGTGINAGGGEGVFEINFSTGSDIGCTIIYFNPQSIPDGIRVQYNGSTFNELASPNFGYLASNNSNNYTFIGATASDCTPNIGPTLDAGGYSGLNQNNWNGSSFTLVGTSGVVTGTSGDVQLTAGPPGYSTLYIPKNSATPTDFLVQIAGLCSTAWDVEINCPILLSGVPTGQQGGDCNTPEPFSNTYYNVPNRGGTAGEPALNEFFVRDPYGNNRVAAGTYLINPPSGTKQINVDINGVIQQVVNCP
jgi:hypothetical protein